MGVITNTTEFSCSVAPARMLQAVFIDGHNVMPKVLPGLIKSMEHLSGEGGPGSLEKINFTDATPFTYAVHRLDVIDTTNNICHYSVVEGDALGDNMEIIKFEVQFVASGDGGCVCKIVSHHHPKGDAVLNNDEIMDAKEKALGMYKAVEAYLVENPTAYA